MRVQRVKNVAVAIYKPLLKCGTTLDVAQMWCLNVTLLEGPSTIVATV